MSKPLLALLSFLFSLAIVSCSGPNQNSASADTVVTLGTMMSGAKMSQQSSSGRSWTVELKGLDLILDIDGVTAEFRGAAIGGAVKYQYFQATSTWDFLVNGGVVHWRGSEVRVGETTHDLSVPGEFIFTAEDWKAKEE